MDKAYIFVDGSCLFAAIRDVQKNQPKFKDKKVNITALSRIWMGLWLNNSASVTRVVYYFKKGDKRIQEYLAIPDTTHPGNKDHWLIKECAESAGTIPDTELQKLDEKYRDNYARAEKGLDVQLACEALLLVINGRIANAVFMVNDRDFVPLFNAIHDAGGNVYLTALDGKRPIRRELSDLCDRFLAIDSELPGIFV